MALTCVCGVRKRQRDKWTDRPDCSDEGIVIWCKSMTDLDFRGAGRGRVAGLSSVWWKYRKEKNFSCYNGARATWAEEPFSAGRTTKEGGIFFPTIGKKSFFVQPNKKVLHQLHNVDGILIVKWKVNWIWNFFSCFFNQYCNLT